MMVKKLILSEFGPYSGQQEIDFVPFSGQVFLIGGDTGAGKTTIFDAICYALYGEPSGSVRKGDTLRNQDAGKKAKSFAEVTFTAADGAEYTVHRDTPQLKKPDSPVRSLPKDSVRLMDDTGNVIECGSKKVTEKVTLLTGFDRDSFLRVSVLPQGEFDKFLMAKSNERRDTLRRIFGTQLYENYAAVTRDWLKAAESELNAVDTKYALLLERYFPAEGEKRHISGAGEYIAKLSGMLAESTEQKKAAEKELAGISEDMLKNNTLRHEAEKSNQNITEWQKALSEKQRLDAMQEEYSGKEKLLGMQKLAAEAAPALTRHEELSAKLSAAEKGSAQAEERKRLTAQSLETAKLEKHAADSLTAERETAIGELPGLESLLKKCEEAQQGLEACKRLSGEIESTGKKLGENEKMQEKCRINSEKLSKQAAQAEVLAAKSGGAKAQLNEASEKRRRLTLLLGKLDELDKQRRSTERAAQKSKSAEKSLDEAEYENTQLLRRYYAGESARLAKKLNVGERCPVCGSTDHPFPAQWQEDIPTSEQLEAAQSKVDEARSAKGEADRKLSECSGRLDTLQNSVHSEYEAEMGKSFPEQGAAADVTLTLGELEKTCGTLQEEYDRCINAAEELPKLQKSLEQSQQEQKRLEEQHSQFTAQAAELSAQYSAQKAAAEEKLSGLEGRTPEMLTDEIRSRKERISAIEERQKQSQERLNSCTQAAAAAETGAQEQKKSLEAAKKELSEAGKVLEEELVRCGFADTQELRRYIVTKQQRDRLERELHDHRSAVTAAETRLSDCESRLPEDRELQPLEAFDEAERLLGERQAQAQQRLAQLTTGESGISCAIEELTKLSESSSGLVQRQQTLKQLDRAINGGAQEHISFEAFIQMRMFAGVLEEANHRLDKMSGGRYRFVLRTQNARANASEGLDIDIIDNNSGSSARRDVSTLSGGERFMASFALATGLSDYTLRQGAGRRSDMLFIDEGFSSLDSDTFAMAFEVIEKLRSQERMVGIITHVSEIQEHFRDMRINVRKERGGSRIETVCRR